MNKQKLILSLLAVAAISGVAMVSYSDSISANESDIRIHEKSYRIEAPENVFTVKTGSSIIIPVDAVVMNDYAKDLKFIVTEAVDFPYYPDEMDTVVFTRGLDASVSKDTIRGEATQGKEFSVRDTVDVTVTVSPDAELGERTLAVTLLSDSGSYQRYLHLNIVE